MTAPETPSQPSHLFVIVGGAVAGSEAAAVCSERGALTVVLEQNDRPHGKIEDGLPRWHAKLQQKEYARIRENLTRSGVIFVPRTALGRDVQVETLLQSWNATAVLLASGAWRDRPLPVEGADAFDGRGLLYQNPFVHWYNHYADDNYAGPEFEIPDGAIVVGGGLASIDVVKIINLQLYKRALAKRKLHVTTLELEHAGIPATLEKHGLDVADLGVLGVRLFYRRSKQEMPLASAPADATDAQLAKVAALRAKVMDKVIQKYLVRFEGNLAPVGLLTEGERLTGLRFQKTQTVEGKLRPVEGSTVDVHAPLVVSSIGSIPQAIPGLPMRGELIDFADWRTGEVRGLSRTYGLGNALTGKGNIKESRKNALVVSAQVVERYLGVGSGEVDAEGAHRAAREKAGAAIARAAKRAPLQVEELGKVCAEIGALWSRSGYDGNFDAWLDKLMPRGTE